MTKAHLIETLAERTPTLSRRQAELVVNTLFDSIRDSLKKGEKNRNSRLWKFSFANPANERRSESQNWRHGCRPRKANALF